MGIRGGGVTDALIAYFQAKSEKDQADGYAGLNGDGHLVGPLVLRQGTATEMAAIVPFAGEPIYKTDTKRIAVGDGVASGGNEILGISGANSVLVDAGSTSAIDLGTALRDACDEAKACTPYGVAISADNPVYLLLPPGFYDLGTGDADGHGLEMDTSHVHLIGLASDARAVRIACKQNGTGVVNRGVVEQSADDISFYNLTLDQLRDAGENGVSILGLLGNVRSFPAAWDVDASYPGTRMYNVRLLGHGDAGYGYPFGFPSALNIELSGHFQRLYTTKYFNRGDFSGTLLDGTCGDHSVAHEGTMSGVVTRNSFGANCVGYNGSVTGLVEDCTAGNGFIKTLLDTTGISRRNTFGNESLQNVKGLSEDDTGGDSCFGSPIGGGVIRRAVGGEACLNPLPGSGFQGTCEDSTFGDGTLAGTFASNAGTLRRVTSVGRSVPVGKFTGLMDACTVEVTGTDANAVEVEAGARIYNSTLVATGTGKSIHAASAVSISAAHCRMNKGIDANVTNTIASPGNVVDAGVTL